MTLQLTWTRNENGEHVAGPFTIRREHGYMNLYQSGQKLNAKRTTLAECKELAETMAEKQRRDYCNTVEDELETDRASRELGVPAATIKPFLTEEQNAEIDHALSGTTPLPEPFIVRHPSQMSTAALESGAVEELVYPATEKDSFTMPIEEVRAELDRLGIDMKPAMERVKQALEQKQLDRDVAAMDADGDYLRTEAMPAAESRKKKNAEPLPPLPITIKGESYIPVYTNENGKAVIGLTSPRGDQYRIVSDGKDSLCSCPSFEHRAWCKHLETLVGDRNLVFGVAAQPEPMPAAESRKKPSKVLPSNTESSENSGDSVIASQIAQDASESQNEAIPQVEPQNAAESVPEPGNGIQEEGPDIVRDEEPAGRRQASTNRIFTATLETLQIGTRFRHGRFQGELLDLNGGDAKVRIKEGNEAWETAHWSPATVVKVGEATADLTPPPIMSGGVDSEPVSGGKAMQVQQSAFVEVLIGLGMPAAKAKSLKPKQLQSKVGLVPEKAKGVELEGDAGKLLRSLLKAVEDGEEVLIVAEPKPAKAGKGKGKGKAAKVSANGESNGHHEGNGHAKKEKAPKVARAVASKEGVDKFGSRLGTSRAAVNKALTGKPKSIDQIAKDAGLANSFFRKHMQALVKSGFVVKSEEGYALAKK